MAKYFMVSAMVPDTHLHEIMTNMEAVQSLRISAQPVPLEAAAAFLRMAGLPTEALPAAQSPNVLALPNRSKNGKKELVRAPRHGPAYEAIKEAADAFIAGATEPFRRATFQAVLEKAGRGMTVNVDNRLRKLMETGRIEKTELTGFYRVIHP